MIPLVHDFTDETVLVFGGGPVGARKARRFDREAQVVVVSPTFVDEAFGDAQLVRAAPPPAAVGGWLDRVDPALVVAATDDTAVNDAIERAVRDRCILLNRADEGGGREAGSVVVPATVRDDPVVVAVSTAGHSPALAAELKHRIAAEITGAGELAAVTEEVRADLAAAGVPPEDRRRAIALAVSDEAVWKDLGTDRAKTRRSVAAAVDAALGEDT